MDDIQKRLKETSEACIAAYEKWAGNKKDSGASETLQEAVHELRKVAARVEIELAISERDENALKPMSIPPHRASHKPYAAVDDSDDSKGNIQPNDNRGNVPGGNQGGHGSHRSGGPRHGGGARRSGGRPGGHQG